MTKPSTQLTLGDIGTEISTEQNTSTKRDTTGNTQYVALAHRSTRPELDAPLLSLFNYINDDRTTLPETDVNVDRFVDAVMAGAQLSETDAGVNVAGRRGIMSWSIKDRDKVDALADAAGRSDITELNVDRIATLGETPGEILDRVARVLSGDAVLHLVQEEMIIDSESAGAVLGVLDGLNAAGVELERETRVKDVREWLDEPRARGRPPLGFDIKDGELVPGENYDEVRAVLSMWPGSGRGEISKRKAAERLDTSMRTIGRAMDRIEMYGIRPAAEDPEELPRGE